MREILTAAALLTATLTSAPSAAGAVDASERAKIAAALDAYARNFATLDAGKLAAHWDERDPAPVYIAEEVDQVFADWPAIKAYWAGNAAYIAKIEVELSDYVIKPLHDDEALVAASMRWTLAPKSASQKPMSGENRLIALMRKVDSEWRLAAWVEAPLAPLAYMRRELERAVRPDFANALKP
jgi:hypothetical protein